MLNVTRPRAARLVLVAAAAAVAFAAPSAGANPMTKCAQDYQSDSMSGNPDARSNFQTCMSGGQDPNDVMRGLVCDMKGLRDVPVCFLAQIVWP